MHCLLHLRCSWVSYLKSPLVGLLPLKPFIVIWLNVVLLVKLRCSLPDIGIIGRTRVAWMLALPLQFTFLDGPVFILGPSVYLLVVRIWDSSLIILATDLLADPLFGFWYTLSICQIIAQLQHAILATKQSFQFINPLMYHGIGEILTFWYCILWPYLCMLAVVVQCMILLKWGVDWSVISRLTSLSNFCVVLWVFSASVSILLWCSMLVIPAIICPATMLLE